MAEYVRLRVDFAGYRAGSLFEVVHSRVYWGHVPNGGDCWVSDGKGLGPYPPTMNINHKEAYTLSCITRSYLQHHRGNFEVVDPVALGLPKVWR